MRRRHIEIGGAKILPLHQDPAAVSDAVLRTMTPELHLPPASFPSQLRWKLRSVGSVPPPPPNRPAVGEGSLLGSPSRAATSRLAGLSGLSRALLLLLLLFGNGGGGPT